MGTKRKKDNTSPCDSQMSKVVISSNMATPATPVNVGSLIGSGNGTIFSPVASPVNQGFVSNGLQFANQGGQTSPAYILPPVFQYPQQYPQHYVLNQSSSAPTYQQQSTAGVENKDAFSHIQSSLDSIHKKLGQLDTIQSSVREITERLCGVEQKIRDIEDSQNFISDKYDSLSLNTESNKNSIDDLKSEVQSLRSANSKLKQDNVQFRDDLIDLKCRSMRDNLLFMGIPEGNSDAFICPPKDVDPQNTQDSPLPMEESGVSNSQPLQQPNQLDQTDSQVFSRNNSYAEDCVSKVHVFCEKVLKINKASALVHIDRAHRVGVFSRGKTRPIVVKFADTNSKMLVKSALRNVKFQGYPRSTYNVVEQYPQEVQERRRQLFPVLREARGRGDRATLVRDKLYINNVLYNPQNERDQNS